MRKVIIMVWLGVLCIGAGYLFWHQDFKYSLPTPIPSNYVAVQPGEFVNLSNTIKLQSDKPLFFHFFNPECPCSKFNVPHFKSLVDEYGDEISFSVVVMHNEENYSETELRDRFSLYDIPVYFDKNIAQSCGVYSTPQAALLDSDNKLFYRGNYNKSRYCTEKRTSYAKMAIDSLLSGASKSITDLAALKSYGCSLPSCKKQ